VKHLQKTTDQNFVRQDLIFQINQKRGRRIYSLGRFEVWRLKFIAHPSGTISESKTARNQTSNQFVVQPI